jgi:uncharacterized repeat protein (TIGR01451 family)
VKLDVGNGLVSGQASYTGVANPTAPLEIRLNADTNETYSLDYVRVLPLLIVTKQANPSPVQDGAPLAYTIHITNTSNLTLTATITDILPQHVTPTGIQTWQAVITAPSGIWTKQVIVTVEPGFTGSLTNKVQVTTEEGASSTSSVTVCANYCIIYLPTIFKNFGS